VEGVALGIGRRDYGGRGAALMGMSAARKHGVEPRALGVGMVTVPSQRPRLRTKFGEVVFVKRQVDRLDLVRTRTDVTEGWVTSREQTILDLADRPILEGATVDSTSEAITALAGNVDWELVRELARGQRKHAALARACWLAAAVLDDPPAPPLFRRGCPCGGTSACRPCGGRTLRDSCLNRRCNTERRSASATARLLTSSRTSRSPGARLRPE
jgi:hypothetical protein